MKRILFLVPLALSACTHQDIVGSGAPTAGEGPLLSTASLSAGTRAQLCPPDGQGLPDLAPAPDGGQPPVADHCFLIDAAVGGPNACCGGDLATQSCGPGLDCVHPQASDIGECVAHSAPTEGAVCIDRHQSSGCQLYAINGIFINDDPNRLGCQLEAHCFAYGEHQYNCDSGTCTCVDDFATTGSFPEGDICTGSVGDALKVAEANCGFPSSFPDGRDTNPWR